MATHFAKDLIGSDDVRDRRRALELADEAVADLDLCAPALADFQMLWYLSFRTETLLVRGDVRCRLGMEPLAQADASEAKRALEKWLDLARSSGDPVSTSVEQAYRDRFRPMLQAR